MKISDIEYQGDGSKATFYLYSRERVDFRQLIKDMARAFNVRIEMRQIGFRQEASRRRHWFLRKRTMLLYMAHGFPFGKYVIGQVSAIVA